MRGSLREPRTVFVGRSWLFTKNQERPAIKQDAQTVPIRRSIMTFVPNGNQGPFPPKPGNKLGPSRERGEFLNRTHDGTGGLWGIELQLPSREDVIEGWPRADQL